LKLRHPWAIATDVRGASVVGKTEYPVVFVELTDGQGRRGLGEGSPSSQYHEDHATVAAFLNRIDPNDLSFDDISGSMARLEAIQPASQPAKCAVNLALIDGAARAAGKTAGEFLGLGFTEGRHVTSFTIGIDSSENVAAKVREAADMPVLKVKVGGPDDEETLTVVQREAPGKPIRVDANAAWPDREVALRRIEALAARGGIQFVEQPMPPALSVSDWEWLKARSPLPIFGDESYQSAADAERCAQCVHGVNVKLVKTGGMSSAKAALEAARAQGLKTMLGCMIESSVLISAAAQLADLTDYLDIDGNLLISNDPYAGPSSLKGRISFGDTPVRIGLRTAPRG
jgi:L-Ala-D/L-Glu epimerase